MWFRQREWQACGMQDKQRLGLVVVTNPITLCNSLGRLNELKSEKQASIASGNLKYKTLLYMHAAWSCQKVIIGTWLSFPGSQHTISCSSLLFNRESLLTIIIKIIQRVLTVLFHSSVTKTLTLH